MQTVLEKLTTSFFYTASISLNSVYYTILPTSLYFFLKYGSTCFCLFIVTVPSKSKLTSLSSQWSRLDTWFLWESRIRNQLARTESRIKSCEIKKIMIEIVSSVIPQKTSCNQATCNRLNTQSLYVLNRLTSDNLHFVQYCSLVTIHVCKCLSG